MAGERSPGDPCDVTNGVLVPTWDSAETACRRKERWRWSMEEVERDFHAVSDANLWQLRAAARESYVRVESVLRGSESGAATEPPWRNLNLSSLQPRRPASTAVFRAESLPSASVPRVSL